MENSEKLILGGFATVVAFGMLGHCSRSRGESAEARWENSQGTQGFINLNAVKDAFRGNQSVLSFEQRVNDIYEGANLVVFDAKEIHQGFELRAYEDLDKNKNKSSGDDLLFTLKVQGRTAELKGAGVNKYYKSTWIYEPPPGSAQQVQVIHDHSSLASSPFFWWWVLSPGWGHYYTPVHYYDTMYSHRATYRRSAAYRDQVARNTSFASRMRSKYGSSFRNSMNSTSPQRKSYIRNTVKSPGFQQKMAASRGRTGAAPRSQMRSSRGRSGSFSGSSRGYGSRSSGFGGFRGFSGFGV